MTDRARSSFLYYGHSTVGVRSGSGHFVLIDPWVEGNPMASFESSFNSVSGLMLEL